MIPTWIGILSAFAIIVSAAITSFYAVRLANRETAETIRQLRAEQVFEKQRDHATRLVRLEEERQRRLEARPLEHAAIEDNVRRLIEKSDVEARAGRKHLHEDIGSCRNEITRLGANFSNLEGWLKTVDERLDQKTTELIAAVANAAGRSGH